MEQNEDGKLISESNPAIGWIKSMYEKFGAPIAKEKMDEMRWGSVASVDPDYTKYGRSPIADVAQTMDVLEAAKLQMNAMSHRQFMRMEPVVFEQNQESKEKLFAELTRELTEELTKRMHQALYGGRYIIGGKAVHPADVKITYLNSGEPVLGIMDTDNLSVERQYDAVDAIRYAVSGLARSAGKTAEQFKAAGHSIEMMRRRMRFDDEILNPKIEDLKFDFKFDENQVVSMPLNVVMMNPIDARTFLRDVYSVDRGWMNHGGDFNIIIKNKRIWKEEYSGVTGPAW